jgi:uncharacterized small protein (DUF1192 family)
MTDEIVKQLREAAKPDFLAKGSVWGQQEVRIALLSDAADEIERLRAECDRWRKIAGDFAEAGTHPTAHEMVVEDYEEACRG